MDFGALPPEINSARMYSGPGSAPMLAAASASGQGGHARGAAGQFCPPGLWPPYVAVRLQPRFCGTPTRGRMREVVAIHAFWAASTPSDSRFPAFAVHHHHTNDSEMRRNQ
jgi:hypothetical protein